MPAGGAELVYDPQSRQATLPSVSVLIACDSLRISDENFRKFFRGGHKISSPKVRAIAPKSMPPGGAQLANDP